MLQTLVGGGSPLEHLETELRVIPKEHLRPHPIIQRGLIPAHVNRLRREWDSGAAGALIVIRRSDDDMLVIDGQHRLMAAMGLPHVHSFNCIVIYGTTIDEEAELWRFYNTQRRPPTANDRVRIAALAGDETAMKLVRLVHSIGREIPHGKSSNPRTVSCMASMSDLLTRYPEALERSILLLGDLCRGEIFDERIMRAIVGIEHMMQTADPDSSILQWRERILRVGYKRLIEKLHPIRINRHMMRIAALAVLEEINHGARRRLIVPGLNDVL